MQVRRAQARHRPPRAPPSAETMSPRNDGSVSWSGCPEPMSWSGPATVNCRNVPSIDDRPCAPIVARTRRTSPDSRAIRKKPRFVASRKSRDSRVDVERVDERRLLRRVDEGAGARLAARSAAGERQHAGREHRARRGGPWTPGLCVPRRLARAAQQHPSLRVSTATNAGLPRRTARERRAGASPTRDPAAQLRALRRLARLRGRATAARRRPTRRASSAGPRRRRSPGRRARARAAGGGCGVPAAPSAAGSRRAARAPGRRSAAPRCAPSAGGCRARSCRSRPTAAPGSR